MVRFSCVTALVLGFVLSSILGCSSPGDSRSAAATKSMTSLRDEIAKSQKQIEATVTSLQELGQSGGADLRPKFDKFAANLTAQDKHAAYVKGVAEDMRAKGRKYFQTWEQEQEQEKANSPEVQKRIEGRRSELNALYKTIEDSAQTAKAGYVPFVTSMRDVRTLLKNDLNPSGVAAARDLIEKATQEGAEVNKQLEKLIAALDNVARALSPTPVPASNASE